jgi:invasion protein IalB
VNPNAAAVHLSLYAPGRTAGGSRASIRLMAVSKFAAWRPSANPGVAVTGDRSSPSRVHRLSCAAIRFRRVVGVGLHRRLHQFVFVLAFTGSPVAGNLAVAKLPPEAALHSTPTVMPFPASPNVTADSPAPAESPAATLPNGASSITETYGDWLVDCRLIDGQKQCLLSQVQSDRQTRMQLFAIILQPHRDEKVEGTMVMPFGLRLAAGAVVKLDDMTFREGLSFSTCMPQGCLLPLSFPANVVASMKEAKTLTVASVSFSSGDVVAFKVSLEGFAAAIARIGDVVR